MYEYITGKFKGIQTDYVVVENNGIGYKIFTSGNSMSRMPSMDEEVRLFIHQIVREDFIGLYGFTEKEELDLFRTLINVNGCGAKSALSLLSIASPENLKRAIVFQEEALLLRAPGIGKKSAQRIILETKDRFKNEELIRSSEGQQIRAFDVDAVNALLSLGYSQKELENVLKGIDSDSTEMVIKEALKQLMR